MLDQDGKTKDFLERLNDLGENKNCYRYCDSDIIGNSNIHKACVIHLECDEALTVKRTKYEVLKDTEM